MLTTVGCAVFQPTPTYDSVGDPFPRSKASVLTLFQPTPTYDSVGDPRWA